MRLFLFLAVLLRATVLAEELTVATFNIRYDAGSDRGPRDWDQRKEAVVETIRKMDPDVLGLQEALWPQLAYLEEQLPEYTRIGVGRDDGKKKGEFSAILYKTARFTANKERQGTFWLSDTPEKAGSKSWGNSVVRICTWAELEDKTAKKSFLVFNTHWDHRHQGSREKSGALIAKRIAEDRETPRIVMGDFNATEANPAVGQLLEGNDALLSSFLTLHPDEPNRRTFNGWTGNREGKAMIDHLLVDKGWTVKKAWIEMHHRGETWPSDHFPVVAVLGWKR